MYPYDNGGISSGYYPPQEPQFKQPEFYQSEQQSAPLKPLGVKDEGIGLRFSFLTKPEANHIPISSLPIVTETPKKTKKRSTAKKMDVVMEDGTVIDGEGNSIDSIVYADTYEETNSLLKNTIGQIDTMLSEIVPELHAVTTSKSMRNKHALMANIAKPVGDLINARISAIKEINNSIKNVNDAEYRRYKDTRAADETNDEKHIMDVYNAFLANRPTEASQIITPPSTLDMTVGTVGGIQMVPAEAFGYQSDAGYQNYLSNLTPEQNIILQENNPDVREFIIYDKANGDKYFQWRNEKTGETLSNLPLTDPMFLADTKINESTKMGTNININKAWPVIVLNGSMFNEY